jgi:hypothetical protein
LLERDSELRTIDRRIAGARAGAGSLLVVEGPPGAGKTVLLAAARERAAHAGMLVLHARGGQLEREFSFGVARQLFETLLLSATPAKRHALLDGAAAAAAPLVGATAPPAVAGAPLVGAMVPPAVGDAPTRPPRARMTGAAPSSATTSSISTGIRSPVSSMRYVAVTGSLGESMGPTNAPHFWQ